jgi:hypothetical protein
LGRLDETNRFSSPNELAYAKGHLYVLDYNNRCIKEYNNDEIMKKSNSKKPLPIAVPVGGGNTYNESEGEGDGDDNGDNNDDGKCY